MGECDAPSKDFDKDNITADVWNMMFVYYGDHMSLQGGFFKVNTDVVRLYTGHFDMIKMNGVIRTCPKASLFAAFRSFGIERRQPSCNLNNQKSSENPSLSGRRIFTERIFGQPRHKTQQILCEFASILTMGERKSARENHGSNYSIHLNRLS